MLKGLALVLAALTLAACAPGGPGAGSSLGAARGQPSPTSQPKKLIVATPAEPGNIALPTMGDVPTGSAGGLDIKLALHHRLATYDEKGNLLPMLASQLPSRD